MMVGDSQLLCPDDHSHCQAGVLRVVQVAYFTAEFGLHESMPLYSGGRCAYVRSPMSRRQDIGEAD